LLPGVGVQERADDWLIDFIITDLVLVSTTLLLFMAWQNHVSLSAKAEALQDSRARLVLATDRERRRIERYLHDGAQQRLVAAAMQLRVAQRLLSKRPEQVSPLIDQLAKDLQEASAELRDLAHGIYPPELAEHGLAAALRSAALRSPLSTTVETEGVGRYPSEIEVNVYFCCMEALQNAIKHAGENATVTIRLQDGARLSFEVRDNGQGCEPAALLTGHGFTNMSDRLGAVGGSLHVQSQPGAGVQVQGQIALSG
jgi:signal transduction histidine kinase